MSVYKTVVKKQAIAGIEELIKAVGNYKKNIMKHSIQNLNDLGVDLSDQIRVSMIQTIKDPNTGRSIPGVPPAVDQSNLIKSIRSKTAEEGKGNFACYVGSFEVVPYAAALEFGRLDGSIAPRPYIRPVMTKNHKKINDTLKNVVVHSIEAIKKEGK